MNIDTHSEIRPKLYQKKPPLGKVVMLPNGVIDERDHDDQYIIKEQLEEYDNFDKNSYFASSLDDHDKHYEMDSAKEKMQSSLGEWYQQPAAGDNDVSQKKLKKQQKKKQKINKKESESFFDIKERTPIISKQNIKLNIPGQKNNDSDASSNSRGGSRGGSHGS